MKNALKSCYFDGMTLQQAIEFLTRCYGEVPSEKLIANVKKSIESSTKKEWK